MLVGLIITIITIIFLQKFRLLHWILLYLKQISLFLRYFLLLHKLCELFEIMLLHWLCFPFKIFNFNEFVEVIFILITWLIYSVFIAILIHIFILMLHFIVFVSLYFTIFKFLTINKCRFSFLPFFNILIFKFYISIFFIFYLILTSFLQFLFWIGQGLLICRSLKVFHILREIK